jgi:wyosine [tRNA(Phe)-imidazoG37] synthetase (radical SAM superfamily)
MNFLKSNSAYFQDHSRNFEDNLYVYPVVSRRSQGVSLGINLSLRKECNFDCPYCQVDREEIEPKNREIDKERLESELRGLIEIVISEEIFQREKFQNVPKHLRVLKDIALSGDGEATTSKYFVSSSEIVLKVLEDYSNLSVKPVVITNGTMLHKKEVQQILQKMHSLGGGPWVKLDASNPEEFAKVAETKIPYQRILSNIIEFSRDYYPIVLQMILYTNKEGEKSFQLESMIQRLKQIQEDGGRIQKIQLYTLARNTRDIGLQSVDEATLNEYSRAISLQAGIEVSIYP